MTKMEQTHAKDGYKRKVRAYVYTLAFVLVWGGLGLLWLRDAEICAHTAPAIYRLALLLSLVYAVLIVLLLLMAAALGVDFCLSGKLRMVVIFEQ